MKLYAIKALEVTLLLSRFTFGLGVDRRFFLESGCIALEAGRLCINGKDSSLFCGSQLD